MGGFFSFFKTGIICRFPQPKPFTIVMNENAKFGEKKRGKKATLILLYIP
jgi:hypothetical protein